MKIVASLFLLCMVSISHAREQYPGQWAQVDPNLTPQQQQERSDWFARQKMPDQPMSSCCGQGDAYYADRSRTGAKGEVIAIVTDERPDQPLGRPNIPIGTEIVVPTEKNKDTRLDPNPTGHTIIFVRWSTESSYGTIISAFWQVYCYLPDGGL